MKAMVIRSHGDASLFEQVEMESSPMKPGHVRVRVHATSVNPVDCKIRALGLPFGPDFPAVLHGDVAGIVEEVGDGVKAFAVGERVFGCAGGVKGTDGALAEIMVCDADSLAKMPDGLDYVSAASLALVSITAWEGLVDKARIQAGDKVLIHAGTGGVGHVAVQIAMAHGAEVFATISNPQKAAIVEKFGATAINYRDNTVEDYVQTHTGGEGFDIVYDTIGGDNIPRSWAAARTNGTVVSCQNKSQQDLTPIHMKGLIHAGVLMLNPLINGKGRAHHGFIMSEIAALYERGEIAPVLDETVFDLVSVADAHARWESGQAIGKIAIRVQ